MYSQEGETSGADGGLGSTVLEEAGGFGLSPLELHVSMASLYGRVSWVTSWHFAPWTLPDDLIFSHAVEVRGKA